MTDVNVQPLRATFNGNDVHLTHVSDDDWHALYFNGADTGVEQNHSLNLVDVLEALVGARVASVASFEVDSQEGEAEWMGGRGFPHYLSDIPQEARITCPSS